MTVYIREFRCKIDLSLGFPSSFLAARVLHAIKTRVEGSVLEEFLDLQSELYN